MTEKPKGDATVFETARHAVEDLLNLTDFVKTQWPKIETKLLDAETRAAAAERLADNAEAGTQAEVKSAGQSANVVFFAECLPYAAAIVHTGSSLPDFLKAKEWATEHQPQPADAVSVLAVLTFIYLVKRGTQVSESKEEWQSIMRRVDNLLGIDGTGVRQPTPEAGSKQLRVV